MSASDDRPIVMLSVFKAGTHLVRRLITEVTGLPFYEPPIVAGRVDYRDPEQLRFVPGHYYSWHLVPTAPIRARLTAARARPIIVLRNVFDLAVSMYHHFADNIDADIGRGRNVQHHFAALDRDAGLEAIVTGMSRPDFRWAGIGPQAAHMVELLTLATALPSFVTSYERLGQDRAGEVRRLARFLDVPLDEARVARIVEGTGFHAMRAEATARGQGSHYRRGQPGSHHDELTPRHIHLIRSELAHHAPTLAALAETAGFPEILASD